MDSRSDQVHRVITDYTVGLLSREEAAQRIVNYCSARGEWFFTIGAESREAYESPEFKPYRDLIGEVNRLLGLPPPA